MSESKSISETLRDALRGDGRTMYRLSKDANVDAAVLSRFLSGERDVSLRVMDRLCRALGLELRPTRRRKR